MYIGGGGGANIVFKNLRSVFTNILRNFSVDFMHQLTNNFEKHGISKVP
jgi:hypothetical protein